MLFAIQRCDDNLPKLWQKRRGMSGLTTLSNYSSLSLRPDVSVVLVRALSSSPHERSQEKERSQEPDQSSHGAAFLSCLSIVSTSF